MHATVKPHFWSDTDSDSQEEPNHHFGPTPLFSKLRPENNKWLTYFTASQLNHTETYLIFNTDPLFSMSPIYSQTTLEHVKDTNTFNALPLFTPH